MNKLQEKELNSLNKANLTKKGSLKMIKLMTTLYNRLCNRCRAKVFLTVRNNKDRVNVLGDTSSYCNNCQKIIEEHKEKLEECMN